MNAKQRRTVRRAKDARRPWGRAVERERRKAKRAKREWNREKRVLERGGNILSGGGVINVPRLFGCIRDTKYADGTPWFHRDGEAQIL